jgi:GT2 family glycosyltransferase
VRSRVDLVTVFHNATNLAQHADLFDDIRRVEPAGGYRLIAVDNRTTNRGFAPACNLGAFHPTADAPIIGFVNPDLQVRGPFLDAVEAALSDEVVITGARFGKPERELGFWGVRDWVCGAALFVSRRWFRSTRGFDEQFVWGWEETDLIRRAERDGLRCRSIPLPFQHSSPAADSDQDSTYKRYHFERGSRRFYAKWPTPRSV